MIQTGLCFMIMVTWADHLITARPMFTPSGEDFRVSDPLERVRNVSGAVAADGHVTFHRPNAVVKVTNTSFSWSYRSKISHRPSFRRRARVRRGLADMLELAGIDMDECTSVKRRRAVVVYEGEPLRLLCDPCQSDVQNIRWTRQVGGDPEHRVVLDTRSDESQNRVVLDVDMSLEIKRARLGDDDGIYRCKAPQNYGAEVLGLYHLEVIAPSRDIKEIRLADDNQQPAAIEEAIPMNDRSSVEVYTHWTEWGRCSQCDTTGDRVKLGYCYAIRDLDRYASGVPCQSKLLPEDMRSQILQHRKNERVIEECLVPCDTGTEDESNGMWNVHGGELADVSGLRGPAVIRRVAREGSTTELQCPRVDIGMVATWYNGTKRIEQHHLLASEGKLTESIDGSLVIADVARYHAGTYECRVDRQARAVYRLVIIDSLAATQEDIVKSIVILSIVLAGYAILFVVLLIMRHCARVCARIKNRRKGRR